MPKSFTWPLTFREDRLPQVLLVSGSAPAGVNEVVAAPRALGTLALLRRRMRRILKRR